MQITHSPPIQNAYLAKKLKVRKKVQDNIEKKMNEMKERRKRIKNPMRFWGMIGQYEDPNNQNIKKLNIFLN